MKLSDFDFSLPPELIAQAPARPRNHARLLVYSRASGQITDDHFYNLDKFLTPKTALVLNDSKVDKARLLFGSTEIFVLETLDPYTARALVRPGRKFQVDKVTELANGICVRTVAIDEEGLRTLKLNKKINDTALDEFRHTPLPPYIKQDESLSGEYQTIYAEPLGSKAAPTAGLHFTAPQLDALARYHHIVRLTLHVGLGTFAPVKTDRIANHKMHSEDYFLSSQAAEALNQAEHITAVGTTSVRVLESLGRPFKESAGATNIFIKPGYDFTAVDSLITNFHLPKSTLLMLVAAFMGSIDEMHKIYAHAIKEHYRFYSFGDTMLIL